MNVYLVRHGESTANAKKIVQGTKEDLSDLGKRQARMLADRFRTIPVDIILASPAERAKQTAETIGSVCGFDVALMDVLREKGRPTEVIGKPSSDPEVRKIVELMDRHRGDPAWHYENEENFFDLRERCKEIVSHLEGRRENDILCVTHSNLLYCLMGVMGFGELFSSDLYSSLERFFRTENTGITWCEYGKDRGWKLHTWNDHAHLGSSQTT